MEETGPNVNITNTFYAEYKALKLKGHSLGSVCSPLVVDNSRMSTTLGVKGQLLSFILLWKIHR